MLKWYEREGADDDIVVASRVRLQRNLKGYLFPVKMTDEDLANCTDQMRQYLEVNAKAPSRTTNLERNLSTEAAAELPTLLESFLLDQITAEQFCEQLDSLN